MTDPVSDLASKGAALAPEDRSGDSPDIESDFIGGTISWQLRCNMGKIAQAETATNR